MAPIVLLDLVLDVDFVSGSLADRDKRVLPRGSRALAHQVAARRVPGVHARVVGALHAARLDVALIEDAVAVRAGNQVAPPRRHAGVAVAEPSGRPTQEFVSEFEVEVVADTLSTNTPQRSR